MPTEKKRYKRNELNALFLEGLGDHVTYHSDPNKKPMLVDLSPLKLRLRVYLWNGTNPPGGRAPGEYKLQLILPGQPQGERAVLDYSDGRTPIIGAVIQDDDDLVFAFWDTYKHEDFAYSANLQVKAGSIISALCHPYSETPRNNEEIIICARPEHIYDAIVRRFEIRHEELMGGIT